MLNSRTMLRWEPPDQASPRTIPFSAHNKKELSTWRACHASLLVEATQYRASSNSHPRLVLFGDSITESWRGTSYCKPVPRTKGVADVLRLTLAQKWSSPLPLGIAADMTQHLLWRLRHGELSDGMRADPQLRMALLIGTNNLGKGHSVGQTAQGIFACATELLNSTRSTSKLLVNALLPRGDLRKRGKGRGRSFLGDIASVNRELMSGALRHSLEASFPRRVHFIDCGAPFLAPGVHMPHPNSDPGPLDRAPLGEMIRRGLMPDRLHPNADGHKYWAACLGKGLAQMESL